MVTIRKQGDWIAANVGNELVMMSANKGNYIGLSEVGARIWTLIDAPSDLHELCARLHQEYEVSAETCQAEVEVFLAEMVKHGAVTLEPDQET